MNLMYYNERLQEQVEELENEVEELSYQVDEHKEDVLFLYKGIREALGYTKNEDRINKLFELLDYEYKAVEEQRKEEQR
jgi:Zn/Cd-binding protein ZinT